eukprot:6102673-Heterocapsa_arctica.AAC.1
MRSWNGQSDPTRRPRGERDHPLTYEDRRRTAPIADKASEAGAEAPPPFCGASDGDGDVEHLSALPAPCGGSIG